MKQKRTNGNPASLIVILTSLALACLMAGCGTSSSSGGRSGDLQTAARGPLSVHQANPRYFTDGSGKAIYLIGSHTWDNLQDMGPAFDFGAYLDFLARHNHNFIRLWRWEEYVERGSMNTVAPHPWKRSGPGNASDGKPKFNLEEFDQAYFERLRSRVTAARQRGIYISIMLFEGWALQHQASSWKDHPFHATNNVNGINGDADGDGRGLETHTLKNPTVTALQERYVRKVLDTLNDLDNVLYEISNETGDYSTQWQYHMIRFIKESEKGKPKQHRVGMTFQYSSDPKQHGTNKLLFDSPADWISPGRVAADGYDYLHNPPPADGKKVILNDTDHLGGIIGDSAWVWKSFCRGHNPIFMDPYDNHVLGKGPPEQWNALRRSLGHTRRLADRVNLGAMTPRGELASTGYCLAEPGAAYIAYLPSGGEVTVDLSGASGTFQVEWVHPVEGTITPGQPATSGTKQAFTAPFSGEAVLYLSKREKKR